MESVGPAVVTNVRMMGLSDVSGTFTVVAPLPPTLNQSYHSYPVGGHCRMVLSKAAREWKEEVAHHVRSFWHATGQFPPPRAAYELQIAQFLARNSRDADSNVKLVMDAVFNGMEVNDNRVFKIILNKAVDKNQTPRVVVVVSWDV